MGTEKGKFQAGLMMERELHWSRGLRLLSSLCLQEGKGLEGATCPKEPRWQGKLTGTSRELLSRCRGV